MEHKSLSLEYDRNLIIRTLEDINKRYIILFLYVIRNDLFNDLNDQPRVEAYKKVIGLDEIFKGNILTFWDTEFTEIAIDLGLFKNIRSVREFEQKDQDDFIRLGETTITIEGDTISIPADTLYAIITRKFTFLTKRNFNLALTQLKSVRCEYSGIIHPFIYQIGEEDYTLSDDLYYLLEQFGNIYQAIKVEHTIEGFYERVKEISDKVIKYLDIFDSTLTNKKVFSKISQAIEEDKEIIEFLKKEKISLSEKFEFEKIDSTATIFNKWYSQLLQLLRFFYKIENIEKNVERLRGYYSGKEKKYNYLEFIEKVSFNEDDIVTNIRNELLKSRNKLIEINELLNEINEKQIKLLNLDYERFFIENS
ncbi:MAG: hypothetical protein BAJALOKI1v1_210009 [Promethearchaeota archaeon]|nr:MAG: hypothetical protein BAJALOKI1v1_210009 [Candidatus Lokiarchaeota archaeon]